MVGFADARDDMLQPGRILGPISNFRQAKWQFRLQPPDGESQEPAKLYREIRERRHFISPVDLAPICHPAAIRATADFAPSGAGEATGDLRS